MLLLKTILGSILVPGTFFLLVPYLILRASQTPLARPFGMFQSLAIFAAALGLFLVMWVNTAFLRHGKGTALPSEPPKQLVLEGLYRYVRNPMYTGAVLVILAEALYFGSWGLLLYAVAAWAVIHAVIVYLEEPQLARRFGPDYQRYLAQVPRWLPRFPKK